MWAEYRIVKSKHYTLHLYWFIMISAGLQTKTHTIYFVAVKVFFLFHFSRRFRKVNCPQQQRFQSELCLKRQHSQRTIQKMRSNLVLNTSNVSQRVAQQKNSENLIHFLWWFVHDFIGLIKCLACNVWTHEKTVLKEKRCCFNNLSY